MVSLLGETATRSVSSTSGMGYRLLRRRGQGQSLNQRKGSDVTDKCNICSRELDAAGKCAVCNWVGEPDKSLASLRGELKGMKP